MITLNRPKALNALCQALVSELSDALTVLNKDDSISAVVITGSGKAFAAGTFFRLLLSEFENLLKSYHVQPKCTKLSMNMVYLCINPLFQYEQKVPYNVNI